MAQEILVKEVLTEDMIRLGADLTRELECGGWPVVASFWLYDSEINQWRLVLASPTVAETGPRAGYRRVIEALHALNQMLPLGGLSVVTPQDPIVRALSASAYARGGDIEGRRVSRTVVDREFVDDAYLYRLMPVAPAA